MYQIHLCVPWVGVLILLCPHWTCWQVVWLPYLFVMCVDVLWYDLLGLWRDNNCLEGPEVGSRGPVTLNLLGTCRLLCGFFIAKLFGLRVWTKGPGCWFALSRPEGVVWAYADDI